MAYRLGGAAVLVACGCCCVSCDCSDEDRGIHRGDTIQTTILSNDLTVREQIVGDRPNTPVPSCGDLGDLPAGAALTSEASLGAGGGEACDSGVILTPERLTTARFTSMSYGSATIQLPNGCTGRFDVYFADADGSSDGSSSYLADPPTGGEPTFWLVRRFQPTVDASLCFPGATDMQTCADAFVVKNVRE